MELSATPGWEREVPRYRAIRDVRPSHKSRHRTEPPFTMTTDADVWQYGTRPIKAGEVVETTAWPAASFTPLNYSAKQVLEWFVNRPKSRMPISPWFGNAVRLNDGLSGPEMRPTIARPDARPQVAGAGFQPNRKISAA